MSTIELMLTGQMEMKEFIQIFQSDKNLRDEIKNLLPMEAVSDASHPFWMQFNYEVMKGDHFDLLELLKRICKFNGEMGDNLNLFDAVRRAYTAAHPDFHCTNQYEEAFSLYLDVIKDCCDGPEVQHIVEQIVYAALPLKTKKARIQQARQAIEEEFHIKDKKRPHWIQGPEWPMGSKSPMMFVSQKRHGEEVQFHFKDMDTNEERTVVQYF